MLDLFFGSFIECEKWYEYVAVAGLWLVLLILVIGFAVGVGWGILTMCSTLGIVGIIASILILFWGICFVAWIVRGNN